MNRDSTDANARSAPYWNPYLAGVGLGLTLLLSVVTLGAGLGASGGIARAGAAALDLVAPRAVESNAYMGDWFRDGSPLAYYLVFMASGVFLGGLLSAWAAGRIRPSLERGPKAPRGHRAALAIAGGIAVGFASRLAMGCTSGQALTGGALLLTGSWAFMLAVFAGAYGFAWFVRRQWI
ncbi:MAG: YeeE/YedE thiosulfate transporter family protein [Planctomycetota bacterium]